MDGSEERKPAEDVFLALGSNLGDRLAHLRRGVRGLRAAVRLTAISPVVESRPREVEDEQPDYLNAVVRGRTGLEPAALLRACHEVEASEGRRRPYPKAPRSLDVDVLFHGTRVVRTPDLTIPHPRWKERGFVLGPLLKLAPEWRDPESGRTIRHICRERAELVEGVRTVAPAAALAPDPESDPPSGDEEDT